MKRYKLLVQGKMSIFFGIIVWVIPRRMPLNICIVQLGILKLSLFLPILVPVQDVPLGRWPKSLSPSLIPMPRNPLNLSTLIFVSFPLCPTIVAVMWQLLLTISLLLHAFILLLQNLTPSASFGSIKPGLRTRSVRNSFDCVRIVGENLGQ